MLYRHLSTSYRFAVWALDPNGRRRWLIEHEPNPGGWWNRGPCKAEGAEACSALVGDESEFLPQSVSRLEPAARKAHLESALGIAARLGVHHDLVTPCRGGEPDIGSRDGV